MQERKAKHAKYFQIRSFPSNFLDGMQSMFELQATLSRIEMEACEIAHRLVQEKKENDAHRLMHNIVSAVEMLLFNQISAQEFGEKLAVQLKFPIPSHFLSRLHEWLEKLKKDERWNEIKAHHQVFRNSVHSFVENETSSTSEKLPRAPHSVLQGHMEQMGPTISKSVNLVSHVAGEQSSPTTRRHTHSFLSPIRH